MSPPKGALAGIDGLDGNKAQPATPLGLGHDCCRRNIKHGLPGGCDPIIGFLKGALEGQPARIIPFKGFLGSHSQAFISRECVRIYFRDGCCDGGDHPSDHDVGRPPRILTTIRLRQSRRFTGLTTGICTEGNRFNRAEQRFGKKGMVDMTGISGRLPGDAIEHGAL
jgi:hypothetical protein